MREIRLRAWDTVLKQMCFNFYMDSQDSSLEIYDLKNGKMASRTPDDFVIMQYTGLDDENNRRIYEGDIVLNNDQKWLIVYGEEGTWKMKQRSDERSGLIFLDENRYSKVIGNIYENPELLNN